MVTIFLGINDLYNVSTSNLETIDVCISDIFEQYNMGLVIDKFQEALPNIPIVICLIPPANERLELWYTITGDSAQAWEYKKKNIG